MKEKDSNSEHESLNEEKEESSTLNDSGKSADSISRINRALSPVRMPTDQIKGINAALASVRMPTDQIKGINAALASVRMPTDQIKGINAALASVRMPTDQIKGINAALASVRMPTDQIKGINAALASVRMPTDQIKGINAALANVRMPTNLNTNWVLSKSVIEDMALVNEEIDAKKIFSKIPRDNYDLNQQYSDESDDLEYILENRETKETIPVRDIPSAIAITDIIKSLTVEEVFDFFRHLVKFPMLGLQHPVGKKIFNEINKVSLQTFENVVLYRVRERDIKNREMPFTDLEMFEAPYGLASHGRFNVIGQGELYTCSSEEVALKEVASENQDYRYDIIKWELQQPVNLLDLSSYDSPLVQYSSFEKSTSNKQEYLVPNFLSQCVKYHGITGIRYKSIVDKNELNYVFFDFEKRWFKTVNMEVNIEYKASELQVIH